MTLPPIERCHDSKVALSTALGTLLEPSEPLFAYLVPELESQSYASFEDLLDLAEQKVEQWPMDWRQRLIAGHPRIGAPSGETTLSALSSSEQQASKATPPEVLHRLAVRIPTNNAFVLTASFAEAKC
jgi:hypothetical protein